MACTTRSRLRSTAIMPEQLDALGAEDPEFAATLPVQCQRAEHQANARAWRGRCGRFSGAESAVIRAGGRVAIGLSKRI